MLRLPEGKSTTTSGRLPVVKKEDSTKINDMT